MSGAAGEFDLIARIRARCVVRPDVLLGIGDDAALLSPPPGLALAVAMDTPSTPQVRWARVLPCATSQVWVQKNVIQANSTRPWIWTSGGPLNLPCAIGAK